VYIQKESTEKITDRGQFWQKVIWITVGVGLAVTAYVGIF
jgi:hypothetical protein